MRYRNNDGRLMFVHQGLGKGADPWGTFWRKPDNAPSMHRLCSPNCPMRPTQEEAQDDLDRLAARYGWKALDEAPAADSAPETPEAEEADVVTETPDTGPTWADMLGRDEEDGPAAEPLYAPPTREAVLAGGDSARNTAPRFVHLSPDELQPSPRNPRRIADDDPGIVELAASIRQVGLLEPIVAREAPGGGYEIIAGERRWRACRQAGLLFVPVIVRECPDDREALELTLIENLQRRDLDPIEEAAGYMALQELGYTQEQIGARVHRSQEAVSNTLRLLGLPEAARGLLSGGKLTATHGRALLRYVPHGAAFVAALAERIATSETPITTRELESPNLPYHVKEQLRQAKLCRTVEWGWSDEQRRVCKACAHCLGDGGGTLECTDPACWDATKAREKARAAEAKEAGGAFRGTTVFLPEQLPDGCTTDCSHFATDAEGHGHCGNPQHLYSLLDEDRKRRDRECEAYRRELADAIVDRLRPEDTPGMDTATWARAQVAACSMALRHHGANRPDALRDAAQRLGLPAPPLPKKGATLEALLPWALALAETIEGPGLIGLLALVEEVTNYEAVLSARPGQRIPPLVGLFVEGAPECVAEAQDAEPAGPGLMETLAADPDRPICAGCGRSMEEERWAGLDCVRCTECALAEAGVGTGKED